MAYKEMTLGQCAKHDFDNNLKAKLTGWGIVSKARREQKISKKEVRKIKKAEANN
jgi:hypothetical protein